MAALGFLFDIYELLMLPLVIQPAMHDLAGIARGTPEFSHWFGLLFYLPAICGGVFGLLGGYLTDRLGRRRVLVWSIVVYAVSAFAAGYSTSLEMLLLFRCTTFVGVSVEFVAAVAWLAELFPNPKQRERVLAYTQAVSSLGGMLAAFAWGLCIQYAGAASAWRYMLMSGLVPAIPLMVIRPFLPESPIWRDKKAQGTLKRPSFAALFQPRLRRTTIVTAIMVSCTYGAAFGAIQHLPQIVPGLPDVASATPELKQLAVRDVQYWQEIGGLVGRIVFALIAAWILSRRKLIRLFQVPGLILLPLVFVFPATGNMELLKIGIFCVGLCTIAQMSFWGNYLPLVYPTHLRGTGESLAANVGGRMIGTAAAWVTAQLAIQTPGATPFVKTAYAAAIIGTLVYVIGFVSSFFLPEPHEGALLE